MAIGENHLQAATVLILHKLGQTRQLGAHGKDRSFRNPALQVGRFAQPTGRNTHHSITKHQHITRQVHP